VTAAHLGLEAVAAHAVFHQHVLAAVVRQELDALQDRQVGPLHLPVASAKSSDGSSARRELEAALAAAL